MAVDTPVLERITHDADERRSVPSRMDIMAEEEHNARIKDTYARLINPDNKIEDVFNRTEEKASAPAPVAAPAPVQQVRRSIAGNHPYQVVNARADAAIFRADSAVNAQRAQITGVKPVVSAAVPAEEENEDLRPTPTTIQYQTIGVSAVKKSETTTQKKGFVFGKREKIIVAVFVAVVIALLTLVIVNATIISNLNAEISSVQESITTVRGAIAGVHDSAGEIVEDILNGTGH